MFGNFNQVGSALRNNTAAININTLNVLPWYPNANGGVGDVAFDGGKLFLSGAFTSIGGRACNGLAVIEVSTGLAYDWSPSFRIQYGNNYASGSVNSVLLDNGKLYVGGNFSEVEGNYRTYFARFDVQSLTLDNWYSLADGNVTLVEKLGNDVLVAGDFFKIGGKYRKNFAALNLETGNVLPLVANLDAPGSNLLYDGNNQLFIAGNFQNINNVPKNRIAKININSGEILPFQINSGLSVRADRLEIGTYLYVLNSGGVNAYDKITGENLNWRISPTNTPNPNFAFSVGINAAKELNGKLFVGGYFNGLNNQLVNHLAAFDVSTKQLLDWNMQPNAQIKDIETYQGKLLIAGDFFNIGLRPRNYFAELDPNSTIATNTVANASGFVNDISISNNLLYLAGNFNIFADAQFSGNVAALNLVSKTAAAFRSPINFGTNICISSEGALFATGYRDVYSTPLNLRYLNVFRNDSDILLGSKKANISTALNLFPNPSKGLVSMELPVSNNGGVIYFYNMSGAVAKTVSFLANQNSLDLSTFSKGLYFYKISLENGAAFSGKLVKE